MKVWRSTRRLVVAAALAFLACLTPSTAGAADWSLYGSYWDTDSLGDAYGVGARATFFPGSFRMELGAAYYEQFRSRFVIDGAGPDVVVFDADTEVIPVELGLRYDLGATRFYLAGGGTFYSINSNVDDLDDEWGLYYRAGLQFPNLFVEVEYRDVQGSVGLSLDLGLDDDDHGLPVADSEIDLSGLVVNVGWRF